MGTKRMIQRKSVIRLYLQDQILTNYNNKIRNTKIEER